MTLTGKAGIFEFFDSVYRDTDRKIYENDMPKGYWKSKGVDRSEESKIKYYKDWRTYQMSDHLPMWIELKIDYSDAFLEDKLKEIN